MGVTKTGPHEWQISTDEKHTIIVDSILISSEWERSAVYCGQPAYFLIYTCFVGEGAPLIVTCKTASGKSLGTITHKMCENPGRDGFMLPDTLEDNDKIYFEVELSSLGILGRSQVIPVYSMPIVRKHAWSQKTAERGDTLTLSAEVLNVADKTPVVIKIYEWSHVVQTRMADISEIGTEVVDGRVEVKWKYLYHGDDHLIPTKKEMTTWAKDWTPPTYAFAVSIGSMDYGSEHEPDGLLELFVEHGASAHVLEFEDVLFYHKSAVMLPDREGAKFSGTTQQEKTTGLAAISTILRFALLYKDKKMLLTGHTDRSGNKAVNFALSKKRAQNVLYIIENDRDGWAALSADEHTVYDVQHILTWAGYPPGSIDGIKGKKTKAALKKFQEDNELSPTAVADIGTFKVIFDMYQRTLNFIMKDKLGQTALNNRYSLNWAYGNTKAVGCGELFPKGAIDDDGLRSQTNRRVEALFFDPIELPSKVCADGGCTRDACEIYKWRMFKREYIDPEKLSATTYRIWLQDEQHQLMPSTPYLVKLMTRFIAVCLTSTSLDWSS